MIILNLLPPSKKAQLLSEKNITRIRAIMVLFFSVSLLAIALTFTTRHLIQSETQKIQNQIDILKNTLQTSGNAPTDDIVKKINQRANKLSSIQHDYVKWSAVLTTIGQAVGRDITLLSVSVNPEGNKVTLSGTAATRDALIVFQNELKQIPFLENLDYPTSYLTIKENIPFQFSGFFNQENVPNYEITRQ